MLRLLRLMRLPRLMRRMPGAIQFRGIVPMLLAVAFAAQGFAARHAAGSEIDPRFRTEWQLRGEIDEIRGHVQRGRDLVKQAEDRLRELQRQVNQTDRDISNDQKDIERLEERIENRIERVKSREQEERDRILSKRPMRELLARIEDLEARRDQSASRLIAAYRNSEAHRSLLARIEAADRARRAAESRTGGSLEAMEHSKQVLRLRTEISQREKAVLEGDADHMAIEAELEKEVAQREAVFARLREELEKDERLSQLRQSIEVEQQEVKDLEDRIQAAQRRRVMMLRQMEQTASQMRRIEATIESLQARQRSLQQVLSNGTYYRPKRDR